jgi:xanthine dehydrogenase YagR molybdenum-binding subunit
VQASIARGGVTAIDTAAAEALTGVVALLTHHNAPRLASDRDKELWVLQSDEVAFRGQYVGAVIANTSEIARHAAELVHVSYHEQPHDTVLRAHRDDLYTSDHWESAWRSLTIANALSQGAVSSR